MAVKIDIADLGINVQKLLNDYQDFVEEALDEGLDDAEQILINNLSERSPKGITKKYSKSWKSKGINIKHRRYVHNTKMVQGKSGKLPLTQILEYSTKSPHQGQIKQVYNESVNEMTEAILAKVKKGG